MTARNDLDADATREIYRRLDALEAARPAGNTDVSRGQTIFRGIRSLIVKGSAYIEGTLEGIGTIIWQGGLNIIGLGTLNVAGPAVFSATLDVQATTRLRGATTLESDLTVTNAGSITVAGSNAITLENESGIARLKFAGGGALLGYTDGAQLQSGGTAKASVYGESAAIGNDNNFIQISAANIQVFGPARFIDSVALLSLPVRPAGTTVYGVVADASGNLYRTSAAV